MNQFLPDTTKKQSYTSEEIKAWLVSHISEQLSINPDDINVQQRLDSYGLESAQAMLIISQAEKFFGFQLSPILLWHYPTIEMLSQRLAEEFEVSQSETFEI